MPPPIHSRYHGTRSLFWKGFGRGLSLDRAGWPASSRSRGERRPARSEGSILAILNRGRSDEAGAEAGIVLIHEPAELSGLREGEAPSEPAPAARTEPRPPDASDGPGESQSGGRASVRADFEGGSDGASPSRRIRWARSRGGGSQRALRPASELDRLPDIELVTRSQASRVACLAFSQVSRELALADSQPCLISDSAWSQVRS